MSNELLTNVQIWAQHYDLNDQVKLFLEHGFDTLLSISEINEEDIKALGITAIGTKKKKNSCSS